MRVLWIGDQPPVHLRTRAREAAAQTFSALAAEHEVSLLCFVASRKENAQAKTLAALCRRMELIPSHQGLPALRLAVIRHVQREGFDVAHVATSDL